MSSSGEPIDSGRGVEGVEVNVQLVLNENGSYIEILAAFPSNVMFR